MGTGPDVSMQADLSLVARLGRYALSERFREVFQEGYKDLTWARRLTTRKLSLGATLL